MICRATWYAFYLAAWIAGLCTAQLPSVSVSFSCSNGHEWMLNSKGESPCRVYAYLAAQPNCFADNKTWTVDPLDSDDQSYPPPTDDEVTPCQCNEPAYSLIQACTACQGFPANTKWSEWTKACAGTTYKGFPYGLSPDVVIPDWANNLDVIQVDQWDENAAQSYANSKGASQSYSSTKADHSKSIKIIIGASAGLGTLLIIVAIIVVRSLRKKRRQPLPQGDDGGVQTPVDDDGPKTTPMGVYRATETGTVRTYTHDMAESDVLVPLPPWSAMSPPSRSPPPKSTSPPRSLHSYNGSSAEKMNPRPLSRVSSRPLPNQPDAAADPDDPQGVYAPTSDYQTNSQAMESWRVGTAGGGGQPVNAPWGTSIEVGQVWPGGIRASLAGNIGADPATRWSPYRDSPATGADLDPVIPPPYNSTSSGRWAGPSARFTVNNFNTRREESEGNPDAPAGASPSPAVPVTAPDVIHQIAQTPYSADVPSRGRG